MKTIDTNSVSSDQSGHFADIEQLKTFLKDEYSTVNRVHSEITVCATSPFAVNVASNLDGQRSVLERVAAEIGVSLGE